RARRLRVSHAFHSARVEPMLAAFERELETLAFHPPRVPVVSNLAGRPVPDEVLCSPGYWVRQVRETVRFAEGVGWLAGQGVTALVEVGPDGVLSALAGRGGAPGAARVPLLRPGQPEEAAALAGLARLFVHGIPVDWAAVFAPWQPRR